MNTGVISSRYARALLKLVTETGRGPQVYEQVQSMLENPDSLPEPLEADIQSLVRLLMENGRTEFLQFVFHTFAQMYREQNHIKLAHLTTPVPAPELGEKLIALMKEKTGCEIILKTDVDPSIIGGFVFDIDDYRIDASVSGELQRMRTQFAEKNKRIV